MERQSKKYDLVLEALRAAEGPLSANELWAACQPVAIGIATIYRALKRGEEAGELHRVEMPGGAPRYEPTDRGHHHHFLCSSCNKAFDLEGCVADLERLLPPQFSLTGHEIVLYGSCSTCREVA